jgi:hypothetical protein
LKIVGKDSLFFNPALCHRINFESFRKINPDNAPHFRVVSPQKNQRVYASFSASALISQRIDDPPPPRPRPQRSQTKRRLDDRRDRPSRARAAVRPIGTAADHQ